MNDHVPPVSKTIEATNLVIWKDKSIRARIDPTLAIRDVIRQFSVSFDTPEAPITLAIRDEADQLVTDETLAQKIRNHETLKRLVPSPTLEALEAVATLRHALAPEEQITLPTPTGKSSLTPLKMVLFSLAKSMGEEDFAIEFVMLNGVDLVVRLVQKEGLLIANSLAYALNGVSAVMDLEHGWKGLSEQFITRLISITSNTTLANNIVRPATIIIAKLVDATSSVKRQGKGKAKEGAQEDADAPEYGFELVYSLLEASGLDLLMHVAHRLEGGDLELVAVSLDLINALLAGALEAPDNRTEKLTQKLEILHVRRTIARLIPSNMMTSLTEPLSHFQHLYLRVIIYRMHSRVEPWRNLLHEEMLSGLWNAAKLGSLAAHGRSRSRSGWAVIGLGSEVAEGGETEMFDDVGVEGLSCLHHYATHQEDMIVLEQMAKPEDRRCSIGTASAECLQLLVEHYSKADAQSATTLRPHFMNFHKVHSLLLRFFLRMWQESTAHTADHTRLVKLVRSQLRHALAKEDSKSWLELELAFLETDYRTVRERQMVELELEDDLLNGPAIGPLKSKLYTEAFTFMTEQRINCMLRGGWFYSGALVRQGITATHPAQQSRPWRFLRLLANRSTIAWANYPAREAANPTNSALSQKLDLASVSAILPHTSANVTARQGMPSPNSFSIMSNPKSSFLDVVCIHAEQYAEWVDGFKMLRYEPGASTKETANYVHILTDLALKVRLLDVSGEGVQVPKQLSCGPAPTSTDFYFASS